MLPEEITKAQAERTARAYTALQDGSFCIVSYSDGWLVQNGDKEPYNVSYVDSVWSCTCPDFQRLGENVRCKHVEAIRLTMAETQTKSQGGNKMDDSNNAILNGWTRLYHHSGVQVTLPVSLMGVTVEAAKAAYAAVDAYLQAGWQPDLEGLEQGETLERISHIVRREKVSSKDGESKSTPLVDVYANGSFRMLSVYLNTAEDLETFKAAFGYEVTTLPLFDGDAPIKRGENLTKDKKYVRAVDGVAVVWSPNPRYEGEGDMKHQKRQFCRWERKVGGQPAPVKRQYLDGVAVNGNVEEQAIFDRFVQANDGKAPASKEALREWFKAHPA